MQKTVRACVIGPLWPGWLAVLLIVGLITTACGDEPPAPPTAYLFPTNSPTAPSVAPLYTPGTAATTPRLPAITINPTALPTPEPTATPRPIPPTPTYRPTAVPSVKPLPSPPAFNPSRPEILAKSVTDWLNKQPDALPGKPEQVENARSRTRDLLINWGALGGDAVVEVADLDGDKQPEIVATAAESWHEPPGIYPDYGFVFILRPAKNAWTSATLVSTVVNPTAKVNFYHPAIVKVADLNNDGKPDIVFSEAACGADTCTNRFFVVDFVDNQWMRLVEDKAPAMPTASLTFEPNPTDNTISLVLFGGTVASPDAGLQRRRTEVYRWDAPAKVFKLAETRPESSPYLYHRIADATAALLKKDYNAAANLYYQAATGGSNFKLWASERNASPAQVQQEKQALTALARFRLALTFALNGERERATATLQEAAAQDDTYKGWAAAFASAYQADSSPNAVKSGCTAAASYAQANPKLLEPLNRFGTANPTFTPADLCPVS